MIEITKEEYEAYQKVTSALCINSWTEHGWGTEFDQRCARAMGWFGQDGKWWATEADGGGSVMRAYDWHPGTRYDHAMMMRDKITVSRSQEYADALASACKGGPLPPFETALQIAEAALKCLEEATATPSGHP